MPLYREWNSDPYSLAAIWKIEEPESFFTERTGMEPDIRHNQRRIERLAGRFLLKHLKEDFPILTIAPDEHDKPRIGNNGYYFSISHSWPYVAAVVSPYVEAGIDIQCWHPRVEKIQHKFLSPEEQQFFQHDHRMITLAWSMKEAAYKWQGRRGVEFIEHMPIQKVITINNTYSAYIRMELLQNEQELHVEGILEPDFSCAYVVHSDVFHPLYK